MPALYSGDALYAGRDMGTDQSRRGWPADRRQRRRSWPGRAERHRKGQIIGLERRRFKWALADMLGPHRTLSVAPQFSQASISSKNYFFAAYEILGRAAIALSASEINRRILWLKIPRSGVRRQPG
jgi:hypothetical protein